MREGEGDEGEGEREEGEGGESRKDRMCGVLSLLK